ncbi:MAG: hypothetical protein KGY54_14175 [Oleiphilaceae bacterium]|nr:hypothetical protein [Oleiphilaceae bacterium]
MEFWLFAPFRFPLNIYSERFAANPAAFANLMAPLAGRLPETLRPFLVMPHGETGEDSGPRFETMEQHGSGLRSLQLFQLRSSAPGDLVDQNLIRGAQQADDLLAKELRGRMTPVAGDWRIVVCDNSVAELWLKVTVSEPDPALLARFDRWSNSLVEVALKGILQSVLYPILDALHQLGESDQTALVRSREDFEAIFDLRENLDNSDKTRFRASYSPLLWVGRVCLLAQEAPGWHEPLCHWAPALNWNDGIEDAEGAKIYLAWGNSVVIKGAGDTAPSGLVDAFLRAQYYFAAMDVLNRNLMQLYAFLGDSGERPRQRWLQRLNARVGRSVVAVDLLAMEYSDTRQEVQGRERRYLEKLLTAWGLDELLGATRRKLTLARERLERLNRMRSLVGQRRVELLLIFVGSVALLELGLTLASLAGPLKESHLLGWLNRVSQDWVLGVSMILVASICLVAGGWVRRR